MTERSGSRRILLEGGVIVGSILLAFAIDASWDQYGERRELDSTIELLRADVRTNIDLLDVALDMSEQSVAGMEELLVLIDGQSPMPAPDAIGPLVAASVAGGEFQPVSAAYDAAIGTRSWGLVPPQIKVEFAALLRSKPQEQYDMRSDAYLRLTEIMAAYGGLRALVRGGAAPVGVANELVDVHGDRDYDGLLADPAFDAWVTIHLTVETNILREATRWRERLAQLDSALAAF